MKMGKTDSYQKRTLLTLLNDKNGILGKNGQQYKLAKVLIEKGEELHGALLEACDAGSERGGKHVGCGLTCVKVNSGRMGDHLLQVL